MVSRAIVILATSYLYALLLFFKPYSYADGTLSASDWAAANYDKIKVKPNITYLTANNYDLKLDLYISASDKKPLPVLIYIHGGGWVTESKDARAFYSLPFIVKGWAVVNIQYRVAKISQAPAAVEDSRCALRWVFVNAEKYHLDRTKIVVMGHSAGGHLALMTAMVTTSSGFDQICASDHSPTGMNAGEMEIPVAAVINWYGPTDVEDLLEGPNAASCAIEWCGNRPDRIEIARRISPLHYVHKGVPPILTIHGQKDNVIPYSHSVRLHAALNQAGIANRLITIAKGKHGKFSREQNIKIYDEIWNFLSIIGLSD